MREERQASNVELGSQKRHFSSRPLYTLEKATCFQEIEKRDILGPFWIVGENEAINRKKMSALIWNLR